MVRLSFALIISAVLLNGCLTPQQTKVTGDTTKLTLASNTINSLSPKAEKKLAAPVVFFPNHMGNFKYTAFLDSQTCSSSFYNFDFSAKSTEAAKQTIKNYFELTDNAKNATEIDLTIDRASGSLYCASAGIFSGTDCKGSASIVASLTLTDPTGKTERKILRTKDISQRKSYSDDCTAPGSEFEKTFSSAFRALMNSVVSNTGNFITQGTMWQIYGPPKEQANLILEQAQTLHRFRNFLKASDAYKNWFQLVPQDDPRRHQIVKDFELAKNSVPLGPLAGDEIQDCQTCPKLVVIPPGRFQMGDSSGIGRSTEKPVHLAEINYRFAVGKYEVTYGQFDECVADGDCPHKPYHPIGVRKVKLPVAYVNWDDATAYVSWLRKKTGKTYRLLSETEFEHVARSGTQTIYSWGNDIGWGNARCKGCNNDEDYGTTQGGLFPANHFGVHDIEGNVSEWVADCWHPSYEGAPTDGTARTSAPDCKAHVLRGGSWPFGPNAARAASRGFSSQKRNFGGNIGFRVARTLP